jgi:hypothetical protein
MYVAGNHAYLGHQHGLYILNVSNPAAPHRVATLGFDVTSIWVRDSLCLFTTYDSIFRVYNVADPAAPIPLGVLVGVEPASLVVPEAADTAVFTSALDIISVANPSAPQRVGQVLTPGWNYGCAVLPALNYALVADHWKGLEVVDIIPPSAPAIDTVLLGAATSEDISISGDHAYVANNWAGMKVLDVADPTTPEWTGNLDTVAPGARSCHSVAARDSFAYLDWWVVNNLLAVDVSDPSLPRAVGGCEIFNPAEDMVLRDSFLYLAEDYRFQVVNVARPRQPQVVGTCNLPERSQEVILDDTLAYIANFGGVLIASIARPQAPYLVGTWPRSIRGVDLQDTILYALSYTSPTEDVIISLCVTDPSHPYVLDSLVIPRTKFDVLVVDTIAYCGGWELHLVNVANPRDLRLIQGGWVPPSLSIHRLVYEPPYIYVAATDGGVCILETLQTGLSEEASLAPLPALRVWPSVTTGAVWMEVNGPATHADVEVCNVAGAVVLRHRGSTSASSWQELDLSRQPAGVYIVRVRASGGTWFAGKVSVVRRR